MLSIPRLNFSCQGGDFGSNLVAGSKILVAMVTKMVLTWRFVFARLASFVYNIKEWFTTALDLFQTTVSRTVAH